MKYSDRITIQSERRRGKPCVRDSRIVVEDALSYLAAGMTVEEILDDFPALEREDVLACLEFAADRERKTFRVTAA
jgi:uncharacterized protein (DUF433 family)